MIELLLPLFTHTVTVPALRYRFEDIEVLVPFLLRELTCAAGLRLAADATRQLSKLPWPGNMAQLERVVAETVARQRSGVIGADELRPECRSLAKRKLTQMEALEQDAIVRSLEDNANNKLQTAMALGMSWATIYPQDGGLRYRLICQRSLHQGGSRIRHGDETDSFATLMRQWQDRRSESGLTITEREI